MNSAVELAKKTEAALTPASSGQREKNANSPGIAITIDGNNGKDGHLGGKQEGRTVNMTNFPVPVPVGPIKLEKGVLGVAKFALENTALGNEMLQKVGNYVGDDAQSAIKHSRFVQGAPRVVTSDTSAPGQGYVDREGKSYRAVYQRAVLGNGDTVTLPPKYISKKR